MYMPTAEGQRFLMNTVADAPSPADHRHPESLSGTLNRKVGSQIAFASAETSDPTAHWRQRPQHTVVIRPLLINAFDSCALEQLTLRRLCTLAAARTVD